MAVAQITTWTTTINGVTWTIKYQSGFFQWPPLLAAATTIGQVTVFDNNGNCPDATSLAHEFHHVLTTNTLHYVESFTIGRLWGSTYWKDEERAANLYGSLHANDQIFVALANMLMATMPQGTKFETINHSV